VRLVARGDAARALVAFGVTGKLEVMRDDKVVSVMDMEGAAKLTIMENAQAGPKVARGVPFSLCWVAPPAGVSGQPSVLEPAGEDGRW